MKQPIKKCLNNFRDDQLKEKYIQVQKRKGHVGENGYCRTEEASRTDLKAESDKQESPETGSL